MSRNDQKQGIAGIASDATWSSRLESISITDVAAPVPRSGKAFDIPYPYCSMFETTGPSRTDHQLDVLPQTDRPMLLLTLLAVGICMLPLAWKVC